jgi:hypothetical protein
MREGVLRIVVNRPAQTPAVTPAAPAPRGLAPAEVRVIKGLIAAGMTSREITRDYAYTPAQIDAARGK